MLLTGTGLLIGPALVPHRPGGWPSLSAGATSSVDAGTGAVLRQQTVVSREGEPNNSPGEANAVDWGTTVSGTIGADDPVDQFVLRVPDGRVAKSRLIVRFLTSGRYYPIVTVWNSKEEELLNYQSVMTSAGGAHTMSKVVNASPSYLIEIRMGSLKFDFDYQLTMTGEMS